jgi:hypothetical protein
MAFGSLLGFRNAASGGEISNPNTNFRKNSGANAWDANIRSVETIPASTTGYVQFTAKTTTHIGTTGNYMMFGLSPAGDAPTTGFSGIAYTAYLRYSSGSHYFRVQELGTIKYTSAAISDGDLFSVHRDGGSGAITYKKNGVTQYTSALTDTTELRLHACPFDLDNRALDVIMERGAGEFNPYYQDKVKTIDY